MKIKQLDSTGNKIQLTGKIDLSYIISPNATIILGKNANVHGVNVSGQVFCNNSPKSKGFAFSKVGILYIKDIEEQKQDTDASLSGYDNSSDDDSLPPQDIDTDHVKPTGESHCSYCDGCCVIL